MIYRDEHTTPPAVRIAVKAVPGSRRDEVVGRLGERLKIKVAAPPEGGKANDAIRRLLARELAVREHAVAVVAGHGSAEKTVRVEGLGAADLERRW